MAGRATPDVRLYPQRRVAGAALWSALGFKNARAFQRARKKGEIGLRLYPDHITGGVFALAEELTRYIADRRSSATHTDK